MNLESLETHLINDVKKLGITDNIRIKVKNYSSCHYGNYRPKTNLITIYAYEDKGCTKIYPYPHLLLTAVHEAIHCKQYSDPNFKRVKGVMHNPEFHALYKIYSSKAKLMLLIRRLNKNAGKEKSHTYYSLS